VLDGILWILKTGAQWADLPSRYPPYQTCNRRFQKWVLEGVLRQALEALAADLEAHGGIGLSVCLTGGTLKVAKKGAQGWVRPSGAKARRTWPLQMLLLDRLLCIPSILRIKLPCVCLLQAAR
jgi:transposase